MPPHFTLDYQVMYYDTDCGGVVHNLAYMRWVEECRSKCAAAIGMDWATMAKEGLHSVLVRHEIDYHSPAYLADRIRLSCWLERVERASFYFRTEVRREEDGKLCVSALQRLALVQMPQGRPCRIPAEWKAIARVQD